MDKGPDFGIRGPIRHSREIKKESKERKVNLRGRSGENLTVIEGEMGLVLKELIGENQEWIEGQKKRILAGFPAFSEKEVMDSYNKGLLIFLKQQYRFFTKDQSRQNRITPTIMQSRKYFHEQIIAYTFDFIQSLKISKKTGVSPDLALKLAYLSYRHDPDVLREFSIKFPKVQKWVIKEVLINHPSNSEQFLINYEKTLEELSVKYPGIESSFLSTAIIKHSNPDSFIKNYFKKLKQQKGYF